MASAAEYLAATQLESHVQRFLTTLFSKPELPINPYPQLLEYFQRLEPVRPAISAALGPTTPLQSSTPVPLIASPQSSDQFYAAKHIAARLDVPALARIMEALAATRLFSVFEQTSPDVGYTVASLLVLVGRNVFFGTLHPVLEPVQLEQHTFVQGDKLEKAIAIFTAGLVKDVATFDRSPVCFFAGLVTTLPSYRQSEPPTEKRWSLEMVQSSKGVFTSAVKAAVVAKAKIFLHCFIAVHEDAGRTYWEVSKEYVLHHASPTATHSFAVDPTAAMDKGVFLHRDGAREFAERLHPVVNGVVDRERLLKAYAAHDFVATIHGLQLATLLSPDAAPTLPALLAITANPLITALRSAILRAQTLRRVVAIVAERPDLLAAERPTLVANACGIARDVEAVQYRFASSHWASLQPFVEQRLLPSLQAIPPAMNPARWATAAALLCELLDCVVARVTTDLTFADASQDVVVRLNAMTQPPPTTTAKSFFGKKKEAEPPVSQEVVRAPVPPAAAVIDLAAEAGRAWAVGKYPRLINTPTTQLQYVVDTRLDSALDAALVAIVYERTVPPEQVASALVQRLRPMAARHVVFQEQGPEVGALRPPQLATDPAAVRAWDGPGRWWGTGAALAMAAPVLECIAPSIEAASRVLGVQYASPSTLYSVHTCSAVHIEGALLASSRLLSFVEHVVIETVQRNTASRCTELFSDAVLQDLLKLMALPGVDVVGFDGGRASLSGADVKAQRERCRHLVEKAVMTNDAVCVTLVVHQSRVVKHYVLHVVEASAPRQTLSAMPLAWTNVFGTEADAAQVVAGTSALASYVDSLRQTAARRAPDLLEVFDATYRLCTLDADVHARHAQLVARVVASSVTVLAQAEALIETLGNLCGQCPSDDAEPARRHLDRIQELCASWIAPLEATFGAEHFLWGYPRWAALQAELTAAISRRRQNDVVQALEALRGLVLFVRLGWQTDIHALLPIAHG
ncbi:hypothetical protein ACHHYP_08183 [Achlya hypogyna]|uniref:Uncharacterized protein n=1 Tax=Achlya hypogyna TaxID=1202772 RepID=A0A1V9YPM4_ACHHY|nr:hypothetical protein ACHHYP_08183 [Achlya hypogyna]